MQAIRTGITIGANFYEASLYDYTCKSKQCFKCGLWGHTQHACKKQAVCRNCAAPHITQDCASQAKSCGNCGKKGHGSREKKYCHYYKEYANGLDRKRIALQAQTYSIRNTQKPTINPTFLILEAQELVSG